jgi:predicted nucleotidyltransferase
VRDAAVLRRIARRLKTRLGARRVLVFGSVARGAATADSDIDLLVIGPTDERKAHLRMARVHEAIRDLSYGLPISPLVLTPAEVANRLRLGDPYVGEILDTGIEL